MAEENEQKRGPVKVELVIQKEEPKVSFGQKLRRLIAVGLAGGAVTAAVGSLIVRAVLPVTSETSPNCEGFVKAAVSVGTQNLLLSQAGLLGGGFVLFFLVAIFWKKKPAAA